MHLESEKAEPPLTDAEREIKEMHEEGVSETHALHSQW